MARYSSRNDVSQSAYRDMSESYHDQAEEYIDNMFLAVANYSPTTHFDTNGYAVPWLLKKIALYYAMELYAMDSNLGNDPFWEKEISVNRAKRLKFEGVWEPRILIRGNTNSETPRSGSPQHGRLFRS